MNVQWHALGNVRRMWFCCTSEDWFVVELQASENRLTGVSLWQLSCDPDGRVAL